MPTVDEILEMKGREVVSLASSESVLDAARAMNERGIGGVLVTEDFEPVGIFTERDVMRRVVAERRDPATTSLRDVMTAPVITISPDLTVEDCAAIMTYRRVRHIPVVGASGLSGIITSGDIMAHKVADRETTIEHLLDYVTGVRNRVQAPSEPKSEGKADGPESNPHQLL